MTNRDFECIIIRLARIAQLVEQALPEAKRTHIVRILFASVAQLVEQRIRNAQVACSSHVTSSKAVLIFRAAFLSFP